MTKKKKKKLNLKKFLKLESKFVKNKQGLLIRLLGLTVIGLFITFLFNDVETINPTTASEFAKTSVKIVNYNGTSGGSGVVIKSGSSGSKILTNKHVCKLIKNTLGFVLTPTRMLVIDDLVEYPKHDLCMVTVKKNLYVNTNYSSYPATKYSNAFVSGHPNLLPHVLTSGNFSDNMIINVLMGIESCAEEDTSDSCEHLGYRPIIKTYNSQLVTGIILPGSSGSGVFDTDGRISGIVFAGTGSSFSYAFIVPQEYVYDFLNNYEFYKEDYLKQNTKNSNDNIKYLKSPVIVTNTFGGIDNKKVYKYIKEYTNEFKNKK